MTKKTTLTPMNADILDQQILTLLDICHAAGAPAETIVEFVEYGIIEPNKGKKPENWQFTAYSLKRTRIATRLQRDLQINLAGLGLAMDLLEEVQALRRKIDFYQHHLNHKD